MVIAMVEHVMQTKIVIAQQWLEIITIAVVSICFLVWKGCLFHDLTTAQAKPNVSKISEIPLLQLNHTARF
jgi:hypothetical protein